MKIFSDEKLFVSDRVLHKQNDRYLANVSIQQIDQSVRCNEVSKVPKKIMVLRVVGSDGQKCPMVFVEEGEKVTAEVYIRLMKKHIIPWIRRTYPPGTYVFQQDGAHAYTARATLRFFEEENF